MATDERRRFGLAAVAAAVLAILVVQIAIAQGPSGASDAEPSAAASAQPKLKKLKRQLRALRRQLEALARQPGPQGPQGLQGSPGLSELEVVETQSANDSASPKNHPVNCPAGKRLVGTGASLVGGNTGLPPFTTSQVALTGINPGDSGMVISAMETTATGDVWRVIGKAICARVAD